MRMGEERIPKKMLHTEMEGKTSKRKIQNQMDRSD
jgi:hypothetical protein